MELLDLRRHGPRELLGKRLRLDGRDYRVGPEIPSGEPVHAHRLVNTLAGMSHHILKVRPGYREDPAAAREASRQEERDCAELRAVLLTDGPGAAAQCPVVTCREAHGGAFELQESFDAAVPGALNLRTAANLQREGDLAGAIALLRELLQEHPHHSLAWNRLGACYEAQGELSSAQQAAIQAVQVEPNCTRFRGREIRLTLKNSGHRAALRLFEQFRQCYPLIADYHLDGIQAALQCGEPERAGAFLAEAALPGRRREQATLAVKQAQAARDGALALAAQARERIEARGGADAEAVSLLKQAHAIYGDDPILAANLAFAMRTNGEAARASRLLQSLLSAIAPRWIPDCYANAAFCEVQLGAWPEALHLLRGAMLALRALGAGENAPDAPGVALWIEAPDLMTEMPAPGALSLIEQALFHGPDANKEDPEVLQLAELRRTAERIMAGAPARRP